MALYHGTQMAGHTGALKGRTCQQLRKAPHAMTTSETRLKRAIYRANYRGTKELDLLLGRFANAEASSLTDQAFDAFEQLLALPDPQIDQWIKGDPPPPGVADIIVQIRRFHGFES